MNKTHIALVAAAALAAVMLASPVQAHTTPVRNPCAGIYSTEPQVTLLFQQCATQINDADERVATAIAEAVALLPPLCYDAAPTPLVDFAEACLGWIDDVAPDTPGDILDRVQAILEWVDTYSEQVDVWFTAEGDKIDAYREDLANWGLSDWSGAVNGWFTTEAGKLTDATVALAGVALCPVTGPAPCAGPTLPGVPSMPPQPDPPLPGVPTLPPTPDLGSFPSPI